MAEPRFYIDLTIPNKVRFDFATQAERDSKYIALKQFLVNNGLLITQATISRIDRFEWQIINKPEYKRDSEVTIEIN